MSLRLHPGTATLLAKAERAAAAAAAALDAGAADIAAGRAFAAIVNAAKAVLNEQGLRPHSHARIAAALARLDSQDAANLAILVSGAVARRRDQTPLTYEDTAEFCERARESILAARREIQRS